MCFYCDATFDQAVDLRKHTQTRHEYDLFNKISEETLNKPFINLDITDLQCKFCCKSVESLLGVLQHLNKEHDKKYFESSLENIFCFKFDGVNRCLVCTEEFRNFSLLLLHMHKKHMQKKFTCNFCKAAFTSYNKMFKHTQRAHLRDRFTCTICNRKFEGGQRRAVHMRVIHHVGIPNCDECSAEFKTMKQRLSHLETEHNLKEFNCKLCLKAYKDVDSLNNHNKRTHLKLKKVALPTPFKCDICHKSFRMKRGVTRHKNSVHTKAKVDDDSNTTDAAKEKVVESNKQQNITETTSLSIDDAVIEKEKQ